jgi:hypothetical protein
MGMSSLFLRDAIAMKKAGYLDGCSAVAEIGAQQITEDVFGSSQLIEFCALHGVAVPNLGTPVEQERFAEAAPFSRPLWEALGYRYLAIDIDGSPGALSLDLNYDEVPAEHRNAYGLVTNLGTTEHIANQAQAFKIIHDLTAVKGIMMHRVPAQGYMTHGLVNYNPKFFWMLSRSNAYNFIDMELELASKSASLHCDIVAFLAKYRPPSLWHRLHSRTRDSNVNLVMQKTRDAPYLPPIDVNTGTAPPSEKIKQRYWAVYSQWMTS